MDWSTDNEWIRTSSGDYEVLFYDVKNKLPNSKGHNGEKEWATNTIKYGEDRKEIKPHSEDRTHVNDVYGSG